MFWKDLEIWNLIITNFDCLAARNIDEQDESTRSKDQNMELLEKIRDMKLELLEKVRDINESVECCDEVKE